MVEKLYRWVKASERLPEFESRDKSYVVRFKTIPDEFGVWKWDWINERVDKLCDLEWLCEIEPPTSLPGGVSAEEILYEHWKSWANKTFQDVDVSRESFNDNFHHSFVLEAMSQYASSLVKQREETIRELREMLRQIDKSLYIGKDLDDVEILKWYIDVCSTIKEDIQELLSQQKI